MEPVTHFEAQKHAVFTVDMSGQSISPNVPIMVHPITSEHFLSIKDVEAGGMRLRNSWQMIQFTSGSDVYIYDFEDDHDIKEVARIESLESFMKPERYMNIGCKQCLSHFDDDTQKETRKYFDENEYHDLVIQRISDENGTRTLASVFSTYAEIDIHELLNVPKAVRLTLDID